MNSEQLTRMARRSLRHTRHLVKVAQEHAWYYPDCHLARKEAERWAEKTAKLIEQAEKLVGIS